MSIEHQREQLPDYGDGNWESHTFQSTNLNVGKYNKARHVLHLEFVNGHVYEIAIKPENWDRLKQQGGQFYHKMIKPYHPGKMIVGEPRPKVDYWGRQIIKGKSV